MAGYFLDTSALVKRYAAEAGTAWVRQLTDPQERNAIYISDAAGPELVAALVRKAKGNALSPADLRQALTTFRMHWRLEYRRILIHAQIIEQAMLIAEKHALRGYDAVHLATVLELADIFRGQGVSAPVSHRFAVRNRRGFRPRARRELRANGQRVHTARVA